MKKNSYVYHRILKSKLELNLNKVELEWVIQKIFVCIIIPWLC